jgi:uncharacterized integral membrane protein
LADPHHVEPLDGFDRLTVGAYRAGIVAAGLAVAGLAVAQARGADDGPMRIALLLGLALVGAHLHLYDRVIRWQMVASGWLGAVLLYAGAVLSNGVIADAGLGFAFVTLSGVALKERYCFKLPLVNGVPLALGLSLLPLRLGLGTLSAVLLGIGAALLLLLAAAKLRMPMHYDIGDRSKYQV